MRRIIIYVIFDLLHYGHINILRRVKQMGYSWKCEFVYLERILKISITRTSIKVLAHNISFIINKLTGNHDSIAKIKRLVFG